MALIYPKEERFLNDDVPFSEREIYKKLSRLSNDFVIFHSVQWVKKNSEKPFTWYENDFLVIHKKYGILVLEVKGGIISFKDGLFCQTNSDSGETRILDEGNDPLSQGKRAIYHYRKLLDKRIPGIGSRIDIEPCVWFPSCELSTCGDLPLLYEEVRGAILDGTKLNPSSTCVQDVFSFYNSSSKTSITDDEFETIISIIAPEFDLIQSSSVIKNEIDYCFLKLTKEQEGLLDYISEQRVATIQGAAGTGKTLIALEASRRFAKEGKKVLFLCFNRFLFEHLKFDCPINGVDFFNIPTFVSKYSKLDISSPKIRAKELQKIDFEKFDYQAVVIDEAQDFENEEIQFLATVCELKNSTFYVFYDKNQLLTTSSVPEWINKSECKLVLSRNCRNTYEIACSSYNVIDVPVKANVNMVSGIQPTITFIPNKSTLSIGRLIKFFKNDGNGYLDNEITILSMKPEDDSIMNGVNKIDGIIISRERNNKTVFYTTAKKFKGLESKVIIITDIDESCFSDDKQKRVFYVACSRACHRLALVVDGNEARIKSIANSIQGMKFSSKGNLMMKTKTSILEIK